MKKLSPVGIVHVVKIVFHTAIQQWMRSFTIAAHVVGLVVV